MSARPVISTIISTKGKVTLTTVHIRCRVRPNVDKIREGVNTVTDDVVELNVAAQPRDGAANDAVIRVMSEALGISKTNLQIIHGLKSRDKTIKVQISPGRFSGATHNEDLTKTLRSSLESRSSSSKS